MFLKRYEVDGAVYRLWRVGSWFHPCQWYEDACRRRIWRERAEGVASMWRLTGFHRMVGSWIPGAALRVCVRARVRVLRV